MFKKFVQKKKRKKENREDRTTGNIRGGENFLMHEKKIEKFFLRNFHDKVRELVSNKLIIRNE